MSRRAVALATAALIGVSRAECVALTVNLSAPINEVEPFYTSWNIDSSRDRLFFDIDLSNATIQYLASVIGGGRLRFGGTGNDALYYGLGDAPACAPTVPAVYECLNETWWINLNKLADVASSPIVAGLNIHPANASSPPSGSWDSTNAAALLSYAKAHGQALYALELGNEQNTIMTASEQAAAFSVLAGVLDVVYGPPGTVGRPLLIGPDTHSFHDAGSSTKQVLTYLSNFTRTTASILHAVTHHEYIEIDAANVLNATFLDNSAAIAHAVVKAVRGASPTVQVWAGEIGPHNGGTMPNPNCAGNHVCGRFGSAVWYADSLAAKATAGYSVYCRQDLIGADYGLLNYTTLAPSPDFWLLALWKQLVGTRVFAVAPTAGLLTLRSYAFCSVRGSNLTLVIINLDEAPACITSPIFAAPNATMALYTMTAGEGGVVSASALLNGRPLVLDNAGRVPDLPGVSQSVLPGATITLAPVSVNFVLIPLASADAALCP